MQYKIVFAETAARDLSQIFEYIADQSSTERALAYLSRLQESIYSLKQFPEPGNGTMSERACVPLDLNDGLRLRSRSEKPK